jgi:hypothetical protein
MREYTKFDYPLTQKEGVLQINSFIPKYEHPQKDKYYLPLSIDANFTIRMERSFILNITPNNSYKEFHEW